MKWAYLVGGFSLPDQAGKDGLEEWSIPRHNQMVSNTLAYEVSGIIQCPHNSMIGETGIGADTYQPYQPTQQENGAVDPTKSHSRNPGPRGRGGSEGDRPKFDVSCGKFSMGIGSARTPLSGVTGDGPSRAIPKKGTGWEIRPEMRARKIFFRLNIH